MSFINWRVATAEDLATLNAQLIKTELQRQNLSTTGNKEELIDRLLVDTAKDPPPNHEPAPCVPEISTSFPTMPVPTTSFPAMPAFTSDPAENMQRMAAFLHQNMAIMMATIASHANPVHPTAEPLQFEYEPDENEPLWSQLNKAALVQLETTCPTSPLQTSSSSPLPSDPLANVPDDPLNDNCLGAQLNHEEQAAVKRIVQRQSP
ncbi:hypothetical protein HPB49_016044 [Dermacentor silvarum]|uniref:Uncharacterized protein n=1 Tax=Dermacentor silvarum TaxID=543639 RepID=A0ACB8CLQ0_DERSI|nr:hypothetical protein HPB49_016044 [Dermacentor silvarum]